MAQGQTDNAVFEMQFDAKVEGLIYSMTDLLTGKTCDLSIWEEFATCEQERAEGSVDG